jgi:CobQ-like glutamine amidotransferase family enzyme
MTLSIIRIHNELLGTYGDRGNSHILAFRAKLGGIESEIVDVSYRDSMPTNGDIYLLGGAEDAAQVLSCEALRGFDFSSKVVLAVCAGFQILGNSYYANGKKQSGLGVIDMETVPGTTRFVGDIKIDSDVVGVELTGFENHGGATNLGPSFNNTSGITPLGRVITGQGNGFTGVDGAVVRNVFGTYLHGPVLARNPEFADLLLERAVGHVLPRVEDPIADEYARWRRAAI